VIRVLRRGLLLIVVLLALAAAASLRVVDEGQVAFRTLLGDPAPRTLPGFESEIVGPRVILHVPGVHEVDVYDRTVQRLESAPLRQLVGEEVLELRYVVVWRVTDARALHRSARPAEVAKLVSGQVDPAVRTELSTRSLGDLLAGGEAAGDGIRKRAAESLSGAGIEVLDVGIRELRYPDADFARKLTQIRDARVLSNKGARAEAKERVDGIRAEADREGELELARARKEAAALRGEGDARAAQIYAEAYEQDRELYRFVRSLEAYRKSLDEKTTLVMSPTDPFLRYFFGDPERITPR